MDVTNKVPEESVPENSENPTNEESNPPLVSLPSQLFDNAGDGLDSLDTQNLATPFHSDDNASVSSEGSLQIHARQSQNLDYIAEGLDAEEAEGKNFIADDVKSVEDALAVDSDMEDDDGTEEKIDEFKEDHLKPGPRHRLVPRDLSFHQASEALDIDFIADPDDYVTKRGYRMLKSLDWFDSILAFPTAVTLVLILVLYTIQLLIFAGFYSAAFATCNTTTPMDFSASFAFSLEVALAVSD